MCVRLASTRVMVECGGTERRVSGFWFPWISSATPHHRRLYLWCRSSQFPTELPLSQPSAAWEEIIHCNTVHNLKKKHLRWFCLNGDWRGCEEGLPVLRRCLFKDPPHINSCAPLSDSITVRRHMALCFLKDWWYLLTEVWIWEKKKSISLELGDISHWNFFHPKF